MALGLEVLGLAEAWSRFGESLIQTIEEPLSVGFDYAFVLVEDGVPKGHVAFVSANGKLAVHSWRSWSADPRGAAMAMRAVVARLETEAGHG